MLVHQFTQVERLDNEPRGPHVVAAEREEALRDALRGVELGAYDERLIGWMIRHLDTTTCRGLVSLLERTRAAGIVSGAILPTQLHRIAEEDARESYAQNELDHDRLPTEEGFRASLAGNSGPGGSL